MVQYEVPIEFTCKGVGELKKILVVDDMLVSLMMTENMLATQYDVVCASSGQEAIEVYRQERPDMVLSDLRMPGMSGYELQSTLQNEYNTIIPFMFMTADDDQQTEVQGFENGAMDFIKKPFLPDILLRRVANILQTVEKIQGLRKTAETDALTGLINKASSEEQLTELCKTESGALLMIDLDSFKLVNDIHGHAMGDKVLITFANILREIMGKEDLIGRMGGDEFVGFCKGIMDEPEIVDRTRKANEILVAEAKKLMGEDMAIPLGTSIGCVFVPIEGTDFSELYQKADKALYVVKQRGKHGCFVYRSDQRLNDMEMADTMSLSNMEVILEERGHDEEALILHPDNFRTVYRFLRRTFRAERHSDCIMLITLKAPEDDETIAMSDVSDQFLDMLKSILRRSDVVSKSNSTQFIVLLYNIGSSNVPDVVERIKERWSSEEPSEKITFECEWDLMKVDDR